MKFYPFTDNNNPTHTVIIEAIDAEDAIIKANDMGFDTTSEEPLFTEPTEADGSDNPALNGVSVAELEQQNYIPTGEAHAQVVFDNGDVVSY